MNDKRTPGSSTEVRRNAAAKTRARRKTSARDEDLEQEVRPGRPLWVRVSAILLLAGLIVALIVVRTRDRRPKTAVAVAAEKAAPDIAPMLLEINDVACTLIEKYPESPEAMDVMARMHHMLGESRHAVEYWQKCLALSPDFAPAHQAIGLIHLEAGEHGKAIEHFRQTLQLMPDSSAVAVELSQALVADGKAEEAVEILRKDLERNPKAMASLAMLGHACLQLRQYAEAKNYFLQTIEIGPDYTNAYDGLVKACANLGEEELAKEYAEKLRQAKARDYAAHRKWLKSYDDKRNVRTTLGDIYAAAANVHLVHNDPNTAETYLLKAIGLTRGNIAAREVLAWLYQRQGRYEDAAKTLTELLSYAPNSLSAQMSSAELWVKLRQYDKAEQAYRKAIELTPNHAGGYAALARFFLEFNRKLPEAQGLARKALELEPLPQHQLLYQAACEQVAAAERSK